MRYKLLIPLLIWHNHIQSIHSEGKFGNSYLSHRIINSFPRILKRKNLILKAAIDFDIVEKCLYYDAVHVFFFMTVNRF